ncbi:nucleotidyltransferase, partial [Amphibacillus sediminis]|uniref:nucleotidyltransferase n=1 Tax=Amphibacillus sediminis TaxID=360185 RepID=UPI00082FD5E9
MRAVGLIVEYNPFHNGHLYHIEQAKLKSNADVVIAVMSGHFLQRGEPAIVDKFTRARMAIEHGVDLVFELPTLFAIQHSDLFGFGAVSILNQLDVDHIVFGSEIGDITPFYHAANQIKANQKIIEAQLKQELAAGNSYPKAYLEAMQTLISDTDLDLHQPNNILGLSYVKAQAQINPQIKLDTIQRIQADYHQEHLTQPVASATSIRLKALSDLTNTDYKMLAMPRLSFDLLKAYANQAGLLHHWDDYFPYLKYRLLSDSYDQLQQIHGMTEGLEYRLKDKVSSANDFPSFLAQVLTKRYTKTRIQRLFTHILLNISERMVQQAIRALTKQKAVDRIRLLGMSQLGQAYLNHTKKERSFKIISQLKQDQTQLLQIDELASNLYYLPLAKESQAQLKQQEFAPPYIK